MWTVFRSLQGMYKHLAWIRFEMPQGQCRSRPQQSHVSALLKQYHKGRAKARLGSFQVALMSLQGQGRFQRVQPFASATSKACIRHCAAPKHPRKGTGPWLLCKDGTSLSESCQPLCLGAVELAKKSYIIRVGGPLQAVFTSTSSWQQSFVPSGG
jgi:hypothetical protein